MYQLDIIVEETAYLPRIDGVFPRNLAGSQSGLITACMRGMDGAEKRFVYILRSETDRSRHYVGVASNPRDRLDWRNGGPCGYTVAYRPWSLAASIEFRSEREARRFEKYLKSRSGRAFAKRHFAGNDMSPAE